MADPDRPFYAPDRQIPKRQPTPGFKLWTLTDGKRTLTCELRDNDRVGAGVDVQLLEDGELLVSTQCMTANGARFVAESYKQDHLRQGWAEVVKAQS